MTKLIQLKAIIVIISDEKTNSQPTNNMGFVSEDRREKAIQFTTRFAVVGFFCYVAGALQLLVDQDLMEMFPWGITTMDTVEASTITAAEAACGTATAQATTDGTAYGTCAATASCTTEGATYAASAAVATTACTAAGMASADITKYSGVRGSYTKITLVYPTSAAGTTHDTVEWADDGSTTQPCYDQMLVSTIFFVAGYLCLVFSVFFTSKRGDAYSDSNKKNTLIANFAHVALWCFGFYNYYTECATLETPAGFTSSTVLGFLEDNENPYGWGAYLSGVGVLSQVWSLLVNIGLDAGVSSSGVY